MEFQFGDWLVSPEANIVSNGDAKTQLEPRVMAVLRYLCRHPGAVIPAEEILQACWGSNELGDNPVHKAITQLRRAFGDSTTDPRYIETIRKRGYRAIAPVVTLAAPPSTTWEGGSPFRGLEAFQENHAAIFFGRVQATAQLRELVLTQAAHGCPMALILGPSGSGKTSLVRAGLLPQLMAGAVRSDEPIGLSSTVYLDCADLGSGTLFQALAGALIDAEINGAPLFPGSSADSLGQRLASDPGGVATELCERACPRTAVGVFIDRLEAVFRAQPDEANRFIDVIDALAKSNCLLMLAACRNDFYPEVMAQPVLLALKSRGAHFDVLPPDGADIAQIVRQPAIAASLTFETDEATGASLDDVLCDAARGSPDTLPLLQYCLNELYRERSEDGVLRFEIYRQLGGIEGAVGVRAEQVVSTMTTAQMDALPHVLSLLVNVGEDQSAVTSRRSAFNMLRTEEERELVRVMIEARLFVSELSGDVPSFGVAHEALLRRWPRVADWIERHRNALQIRMRLEGQATRWQESSRSRDLLLPRGSQINQASELLSLRDFALTPLAAEYVRASISRARFGERIRLGVTVLIALLAILAGILGITARSAQRDAEQKRADAEGLLTFMLGDFVEKLRPLGRLELLDNVAGKAMAYLAQPTTENASAGAIAQRAKALHVIYEINSKRAKLQEGADALQVARQLLRPAIAANPADEALVRQLAVNSFMLGQFHMERGQLDKAEKYIEEYVGFADKYAAVAPDNIDSWIEQSYAHNNLGSIAMKLLDYSRAAAEFQRALDLKLKIRKLRPNDQSLSVDLSNSYSWLAETHLKTGDLKGAMALYHQEESLLRPVHEGNALWTYRLVLSLMRQSNLSQALGNASEALTTVRQAEGFLDRIVGQDPSNRSWLARLYQTRMRQIELQSPKPSTAAELALLTDLRNKLSALADQDPKNSNLQYLLAKAKQTLASAMMRASKNDDAMHTINDAIAGLDQLKEGKSNDPIFVTMYSELLLARADMRAERKNGDDNSSDCRLAAQLLDQQKQSKGDFTILALQVRAYTCQGQQDNVRPQIAALETMGFRDPKYLQHISTHPPKKGMQ